MRAFILVPLDCSDPFDMGPTNALGQIKPMRTLGTSREVQATNMADIPSVELIEFARPYNNEVNLYVTSISRRLDKETAQVKLFIFVHSGYLRACKLH